MIIVDEQTLTDMVNRNDVHIQAIGIEFCTRYIDFEQRGLVHEEPLVLRLSPFHYARIKALMMPINGPTAGFVTSPEILKGEIVQDLPGYGYTLSQLTNNGLY